MTVFDLDKHMAIAFLPSASGPDVVKFDAGLGQIYVACYGGAISVFHEDNPDHYRKLEDFPVQHAVHSLAVDSQTHRVHTPEQEEDGKAGGTHGCLRGCRSLKLVPSQIRLACSAMGALLLGSLSAEALLGQSDTTVIPKTFRVANAMRVDHAPKIDGRVDNPQWKLAEPITNFAQREPYEGQPPTERTEVRILYTREAVFFGIVCYDSEPGKIVATQLRRDVSQELDDYFEIVIDSSHNRRNAYVFQTNALGTQRDGLITDEQALQNSSSDQGDGDPGWDGVWTSEARITSEGWTATIQIPFSTLNFMQSHEVVWGINFKRFSRRKNEQDLWAAWRRSFGILKISQDGELRGISEIGSGACSS